MVNKIASGNALLDPASILREANVDYGMVVADLGTGGQGYFALQAAKMVGERGLVYGVDILKSALSNLASRAKLAGLKNLKTIWSNLEIYGGAKDIASETLDVALVINMLFQSSAKKENIFKEVFRMVKHQGACIVIDWKKQKSPMGPPITQRLSKESVAKAAESAGFILAREITPGVHHWGLLFTKP